MLKQLKADVCQANLDLVAHGLVTLTWGNVSALSDDGQYVVIKPSGVPYDQMLPEQMVDFAEMANIEIVTITDGTRLQDFKNELRWNEVYYHLARGFQS